MDLNQESLNLHAQLGGKLEIHPKFKVKNRHDLSLVYSPGVAAVCKAIAEDPSKVYDYTMKRNTVAIITDGSAVLGLGNIGAKAALPVMEGKALLFKEYADIDAFPLCLDTQNTYEIISIVKALAPSFAGVNLEDISAPRCFEIERALESIGIPVFHDDQHGTAIVLLAGLINAVKLAGKELQELKVVINGAGAAGTAIAELLLCIGHDPNVCVSVREVVVCDTKGILSQSRNDILSNPEKARLACFTNRGQLEGTLQDAVRDADVFIGVSVGGALKTEWVKTMAKDPIIFALANPDPEIDPEAARQAGAFIVGTGRSDYPNQINNVLAFPGIFRGTLDARAPRITQHMQVRAAHALADMVEDLSRENIIPSALDKSIAYRVGKAVKKAWEEEQPQPEGSL
ncbi:MAG: NADP-dependent malic enzyme [Bacteroidetes bacterium]|jgi:malate dehydrogenase (oxaloacetate-decarboxylating)|nr:NADP-dependent malic enzyme [Bacteroidota bacterium]